MQRKSFEIICSMEVVSVSLFDTGINFKDPKFISSKSFQIAQSQTYQKSSFCVEYTGRSLKWILCVHIW